MKWLIPLVLVGCSDLINISVINKAIELCEKNGGVKHILRYSYKEAKIRCNNQAYFNIELTKGDPL